MARSPRRVRLDGVILAAIVVAASAVFMFLVLPHVAIVDPRGVFRTASFLLIIVGSVWLSLNLMGKVFERVSWRRAKSHAHARSVWRLATYVVWGGVLLALFIGFMGDLATTALSLGILGAALAFILQRPLLNLAGWALITIRQLYRIGDRIEIGGVRGYVTDVGLMYTELQEFGEWMHGDTFTGRNVAIPNASVIEGPTRNYTRDFPFVWDEVEALVTYESDIDAAKSHMMAAAIEVVGGIMFENYEKYRDNLVIRDLETSLPRTPEIRMGLGDSGVKLRVVYFCPVETRGKIKSQVAEKIWRKFTTDPSVALAYPHLEIVRHEGPQESGTAHHGAESLVRVAPGQRNKA